MNNKNQINKAKEQGFEQAFNIIYAVLFITIVLTQIAQ